MTTIVRLERDPTVVAISSETTVYRIAGVANAGPPGPTSLVGVLHGATADTARPLGAAVVQWIGSVEPTNAVDGDLWTNTA